MNAPLVPHADLASPLADSASAQRNLAAPQPGEARPSGPRRRALLPRFGLRSLFVAALIFCLASAWFGRNLYRARQEDAAIERLKQAGATLRLPQEPQSLVAPETLPDAPNRSRVDRAVEAVLQAVGWTRRPQIGSVELVVDDPQEADEALAALRSLPEVESLSLAGAGFDDDSLAILAVLPRVESLSLLNTGATGAGLARIYRPERLRTLILCEEDSTQTKLLSGMSPLTEVRRLCIESPHIWREEVAWIAALPRLESLTMRQPEPILEQSLADLAQATGLRTLEMRSPAGIPFDPEASKTIARLPNLESLWIQSLRDDDVPLLAGAPRLKRLILYEAASPESAQRFSQSHPECEVRLEDWNGTWGTFRAGKRIDSVPSQPAP